MKTLSTYLIFTFLALAFFASADGIHAQTPAGTRIDNTGKARYQFLDGTPDSTRSNVASITVIARTTLSLRKTVTPASAVPHDTVTFTLIARNAGNAAMPGVVVRDTVPAAFTILTAGAASVNAQSVTWNVGLLQAGKSDTLRISARVQAQVSAGSMITNFATGSDSAGTPVTASATVTINSAPRFDLSKSVSRDTLSGGDSIRYIIRFRNSGNTLFTHLVIADTLPAQLAGIRLTGNGTLAGGIVTASRDSFAIGATDSIVISGFIASETPGGTVVRNSVRGTADNGIVGTASVSTFVTPVTSLALLKTVSVDTASAGDSLTYRIRVTNTGNTPLVSVAVADTISPFLTNVTVSSNAIFASGIVTYAKDTLQARKSDTITVKAFVGASTRGGTRIQNIAYARSAQGTTQSSQVSTLIRFHAVLTISKTASRDTIDGGQQLTYVIRLRSAGTDPITHVTVNDTLPAGFTNVVSSSNSQLFNGIVRYQKDTLQPGAADSITITGTVQAGLLAGTVLRNTAYARSSETPAQTGTAASIVATDARLVITKTASKDSASSFDAISYSIVVRNTGNAPLSAVSVLDTIPGVLTNIAVSSNAALTGHVASYFRDTLGVGAVDSVTITAKMPAASVSTINVRNTATVRSNQTQPQSAGAGTVLAGFARIGISKTVSQDTVVVGDTLRYTIIVRNPGTIVLTDVAMTDTIPSQIGSISVSPNASLAGKVVSFATASLAIGEVDTIVVRGRLAADRPNREQVLNTVYARSVETGIATSQARFVTHVVIPDHSCRISLTAEPLLVVGNDTAASVLRAFVSDSLGNPKPDGTPITFTTSIGRFSNNLGMIVHYTEGGYVTDSLRVLITGHQVVHALAAVTSTDPEVCVATDTVDVVFFPGAVSGYVVDRITDLTVEGAVVKVYSSANVLIGSATTKADGKYLIPVPRTDNYRITVTIKNNFNQDVTLTSTVFVGVPDVGGVPPVPNNNSVSGTMYYIVSNTPIPAANVLIDLETADTSAISKSHPGKITGTRIDSTFTDSLGIYRFNDIPAGSYRVRIDHKHISGINTVVNLGNGEYVINTNLPVLLNPSIAFTKTGPATASVIDTVSYSINVTNSGSLGTTNTIIKDTLDQAMIFIDANAAGAFDSSSNSITWNLGALDSVANRAVVVRVRFRDTLTASRNLVNHATLRANEIIPVGAEAVTRVLVRGKINIWKNASTAHALPGDTIAYTIHVKNLSNESAAENIVITDPLPNEVTFLSADTVSVYDPLNKVVTINVDSLGMGAERQFVLRTVVRRDLLPGDYSYTNSAVVVWHGGEANSRLDTASHAQVTTTLPYLAIQKQAVRKVVEIGDIATYVIHVTNLSPISRAVDINVVDRLPFSFTYIAGSSFRDTVKIANPTGKRELTWHLIDTLLPHATVQLTYRLAVGAGAADGDGINEAYATATSPFFNVLKSPAVQERVEIRRGVFSERGIVIGKVFYDDNQSRYQDPGEKGVKGVELMMEDGTRIITGDDGKYSLPDVAPGEHVIRVREHSLPKGAKLLLGYDQFAGVASSRFVKVPESGIARADFYLQYTPEVAPPPVPADLSQFGTHIGTAGVRRITEPRNVVFIDDERWASFKLPGSNFDVGKAHLHAEAGATLKSVAQILREDPDQTVTISGHTDSVKIHTKEFPSNKELSEARANAVKQYLVNTEHIDPARIATGGFGQTRPLTSNTTKEGRALNRRVEIYLGSDIERPKRLSTTVIFRVPVDYEGRMPVQRIEISDRLDTTFHIVEGSGRFGGNIVTPAVDGQNALWTLDTTGTAIHGMLTYEATVYRPAENLKTVYSTSRVKYLVEGNHVASVDSARTTNQIAIAVPGKAINYVLSGVLFDVAKSSLRANALNSVETAAELLKVNNGSTAIVEGHTDSRPIHTPEFNSNIELSQARANTVADLISKNFNIDRSRLQTNGWGELRPIADNATVDGRQANRRVEVRIVKKDFLDQVIKDGLIDSSNMLRTDFVPANNTQRIDSVASMVKGQRLKITMQVNLRKMGQTTSMAIIDSLPKGIVIVPGSVHPVSGIDSTWMNGNILGASCSLTDTPKVIEMMIECTSDGNEIVHHTFYVQRQQQDGTILHDTSTAFTINIHGTH